MKASFRPRAAWIVLAIAALAGVGFWLARPSKPRTRVIVCVDGPTDAGTVVKPTVQEVVDAVASRPFMEDAPAATSATRPSEGLGRLAAARYDSSAPVSNHQWRCRRVGGVRKAEGVVEVASDAAGAFNLAEGSWTIESVSGAYVAVERVVEVEAGSTAVFFVQAIGSLSFRTTTFEGAPVSGVRCTWVPYGSRAVGDRAFDASSAVDSVAEASPAWTALTDAEGLATIFGAPTQAGMAVFAADGFARLLLPIDGGIDGVLEAKLRASSGPGRRIRFFSAADGSPAVGVSVYDAFGGLIAQGSKDSNETSLPAGAESSGASLIFQGPNVYPTVAALSDAREDAFEVFGVCDATLRFSDAREPAAPGSIRVESVDGRPVSPVLTPHVEIREGQERTVKLPRGCALRLTAIGLRGASSTVETTFRDATAVVAFDLGSSEPTLEAEIRSSSGAPVVGAAVVALVGDGKETTTRTGQDGVARISEGERASWLWITADGYARATASKVDPDRATPVGAITPRVVVTLRPGVDAPIVLRTSDGKPVVGVRIRMFRARGAARPEAGESARPPSAEVVSSGGGEWRAESPRHVVGVSDHEGRFLVRGIEPGRYEVRLGAPQPKYGVRGASKQLSESSAETVVVDGSEIVVTYDAPSVATLEVVDGATATPVEKFRLGVADSGVMIDLNGSFLQGLVRRDSEISVVVPGVGSARFPASAAIGLKPYRVVVRPEAPTLVVEVAGLPEDVASDELGVALFRKSESGYFHATTIPFDPQKGRVQRFAPTIDGELAASIVWTRTGRGDGWTVSPSLMPWTPGTKLKFTATKAR